MRGAVDWAPVPKKKVDHPRGARIRKQVRIADAHSGTDEGECRFDVSVDDRFDEVLLTILPEWIPSLPSKVPECGRVDAGPSRRSRHTINRVLQLRQRLRSEHHIFDAFGPSAYPNRRDGGGNIVDQHIAWIVILQVEEARSSKLPDERLHGPPRDLRAGDAAHPHELAAFVDDLAVAADA